MSVEIVLKCSQCGCEEFSSSGEFRVPITPDVLKKVSEELWDRAKIDDGWTEVDGKHYCKLCFSPTRTETDKPLFT